MRPETVLKNIGLTANESRVYLGLLGLGEANLKDVADKTELPRTSIYTPIKKLIRRGIVEFYKKRGRKLYVASAPEKLLELFRNRAELLEEHLDVLRKISKDESVKPKIKFFEGAEGVKLILNEILQEKRNFLAITCIEDMRKVCWEYFQRFIQQRIKQNLSVKLLTNRSRESQLLKEADGGELRETRFVPQEYHFATANYIFGNKVALISLEQEPPMAALIEDRAIAETQRMYFDLIWKMASSG